jgi:PIN domain nuclease of toxin-antitoxin system
MKLLMDTCAFLWLADGSPELSATAAEAFLDEDNDLYLSTASAWEIAIKYSIRKLQLSKRPEIFVPHNRLRSGIESLPVDEEAALYVEKLPLLHGDPFDRLLVAQAVVHGMTIVTSDPKILQYAVRTLW